MKNYFLGALFLLSFITGCATATPINESSISPSITIGKYQDNAIGLSFDVQNQWNILNPNNNIYKARLSDNKFLRSILTSEINNYFVEISVVKTNVPFVWKNLQPTIDSHKKELNKILSKNDQILYETYKINGCGTPCYFAKALMYFDELEVKRKQESRLYMAKDPANNFINIIYISYKSNESYYDEEYFSYLDMIKTIEIK